MLGVPQIKSLNRDVKRPIFFESLFAQIPVLQFCFGQLISKNKTKKHITLHSRKKLYKKGNHEK
jgi:hypothetical protein